MSQPPHSPGSKSPSAVRAGLERDTSAATVSPTALAPFMRLLEEIGPDAVALSMERGLAVLARWGIAAADLEADATMRVPHGLAIDMFESFLSVANDASAALRAGFKLQRGDYELLEYLCGSCDTLGESIACLSRYYPLLVSAELELVKHAERAELRFRITPGLAAPAAMNEFALASNYAMSVLHVELENVLPPLEVTFAHAAPAHAAVFEEVFGAPVRFGAEHNAIVFPIHMLAHPLRGRDPVLHAVLRRLADHELSLLQDLSAFPNKVRAAIEAELQQGAALEKVAERMHLSAGGLRSRLRQHGATYSQLLDAVRKDHARRALRDTQLGISELAHRLGFAHPPAFHRAFRRWFGVTPNMYREVKSEHPAARFWRPR
ncbi:MAG TPA: AraC family transcriptional regulator ligand-binding domain-containing protein [Polyangiales bacterium]|nr:AraC family transcriptional regulator ligand-binding domain-containing protein [Polyangiales bacterium]